jgi:hypothetical protein
MWKFVGEKAVIFPRFDWVMSIIGVRSDRTPSALGVSPNNLEMLTSM